MFPAKQIVLLAACCAASPAVASVTVLDSRAAFRVWGEMMPQTSMVRETFSTLSQGFTPGSLAGVPAAEASWQASAVGGLSGANGMLRTLDAGRSMVIEFQSGQVRGVGADFFYSNSMGEAVAGYVVLALADGTQFVRSVRGMDSFAGFWSDGAAITRMTITPIGPASAANVLVADDMDIGYVPVPTPGAIALIGIAAMAGRRRR